MRKRPALLAALYAFYLVVLLEVALRVAFASDAVFLRVVGDDDASWRLAWVRNHTSPHKAEYAGVDLYSPTRGWTLRPDLRDVRLHRGHVSSNSRGLRGVREYDYAKKPGVTRIVVIGDSFTFGEEVDDADTYARQLADRLPGVEVLNLGVHGYGHDQMLLYLQEEGLRYQPDVVVLGFVAQDTARDLLSFRDYAKPRFVLGGGALALRNEPVPPPERVLRDELWRFRLLDAATMLRERVSVLTGARREERERLGGALLERIQQTIEAAGAAPVYVYVTLGSEFARPEPTRARRWFLSYCERHAPLACVDPTPAFQARLRTGREMKTTGHWDAEEHGIAAAAILAALRERHLVPAPAGSRLAGR